MHKRVGKPLIKHENSKTQKTFSFKYRVYKKSRPFQIQIIPSLLYYFECPQLLRGNGCVTIQGFYSWDKITQRDILASDEPGGNRNRSIKINAQHNVRKRAI